MDVDDAVMSADASEAHIPPLHRIPPEIIIKIIRRSLPARIRSGRLMQEHIRALLIATSICRYWRCVALNDVTLWSVVPIYHKTLGPLCLERSCGAPLSVVFYADATGACSSHEATVSLPPHIQRIKELQLSTHTQALNGIFSALELDGGRLEGINLEIKPTPTEEGWTTVYDHLLKHAPTLKALRLDACEFRFSTDHFQQFPHLSRLDISGTHDLRDAYQLLTSFPTLTSIKLGIESIEGHDEYHLLPERIVPHPNLRRIHIQAGCYPMNVVLNSLELQPGVHLECEIVGCRHWRGTEQSRFLPLPLKFFDNTSHIEEMEMHGSVEFKCCGSGPSGSFYIGGFYTGKVHRPIEVLRHLQRLTFGDAIEQGLLEEIVISAPRLTSLTFINCLVSKSWMVDRAAEARPNLDSVVDADTFVARVVEERRAGVKTDKNLTVNGVLRGERLRELISTLENYI